VWARTRALADWIGRHGAAATFFVYPFRAQVLGRDIAERVRWLTAQGHEIGQHTHFYVDTMIDKGNKVTDVGLDNVSRCLRRDLVTLESIGVKPKGFTAGGWAVNNGILHALVKLGFDYDCSARSPKPGATVPGDSHRLWMTEHGQCSVENRRLLLLPTTCSIGEWFRWGWRMRCRNDGTYQCVYVHDYDLLNPKVFFATWVFALLHQKRLTNLGQLAADL
jgi:hypothetical protein